MLRVNIICIGKIKEAYFADAIAEYGKRLSAFCKFQITELAEERIKSNAPNPAQIAEVLNAEGRRIMQKISPADYAANMKALEQVQPKDLSAAEMTFPHQMARVILSEQIYRAFEINSGGKYHK